MLPPRNSRKTEDRRGRALSRSKDADTVAGKTLASGVAKPNPTTRRVRRYGYGSINYLQGAHEQLTRSRTLSNLRWHITQEGNEGCSKKLLLAGAPFMIHQYAVTPQGKTPAGVCVKMIPIAIQAGRRRSNRGFFGMSRSERRRTKVA